MDRLTRWHPDTCSCVLVFALDDAKPDAEPVIEAVEAVCPAHRRDTPEEVFQAVLEENRRKNEAVAQVAAMAGADPTAVKWSIGEKDRAVCLSIPGAAKEGEIVPPVVLTTDPVEIQAALDQRFGVGRIQIV